MTQKHQCEETLSQKTSTPAFTKGYSASKDPISVTDDVSTDTFTNKYATDCPVSKCTLKDTTCAKDYAKNDITLSSLKLEATMNESAGQTRSFCVECSNGKQTISKGGISLTQTSQCSNSLSNALSAPTPPVYKYDATKKT